MTTTAQLQQVNQLSLQLQQIDQGIANLNDGGRIIWFSIAGPPMPPPPTDEVPQPAAGVSVPDDPGDTAIPPEINDACLAYLQAQRLVVVAQLEALGVTVT